MTDSALPPADPKRFEVGRLTLLVDRFMTQFIKIGGIGIILAVFGIFIFIFLQVVPLFQGAKVAHEAVVETGLENASIIGADVWAELPFVITEDASLNFIDLHYPDEAEPYHPELGERGVFTLKPDFGTDATVTALTFHSAHSELIVGFDDGHFSVVSIDYEPEFSPTGERRINATLDVGKRFSFGEDAMGAAVLALDYYGAERQAIVAGVLEGSEGREVRATLFSRRRSLFGAGEWRQGDSFDLTAEISGTPTQALINGLGNGVAVATRQGNVYYFIEEANELTLAQRFQPFGDLEGAELETMDWLFGNESLVFTSSQGDNRVFSLTAGGEGGQRTFVQTKEFPALGGAVTNYTKSVRNRAFLLTSGQEASLRYATTETVRWKGTFEFAPSAITIGNRYERIFAMDAQGDLHLYSLHDEFPEAGWNAFFGKVWYEGLSEPDTIYQSSAADQDTEVKYSMIPLLFGSFKGTFYALLFAIPIALLAALYTSQFLKPEFKKVVKPTMEIMASLPSVVLGFLGALWLAPRIESRIPSIIMILLLVPLTALLIGYGWSRLPQRYRLMVRPGMEFLVFIPVLIVVSYVGWLLGPVLEQMMFAVTDPATGERVADFRLWWPEATGTAYDQRNSLIVGFMMGFAVIPIIFTIAEDAMTNVPKFLTSASLALGASRWQTAQRVVLPTASPGVFSALMIGLGRAVGETMIVVMCSGNTPVKEWNIFNGMRTLSANIAVELPEAPKGETHYRILFLGALLLFILTFIINTVAEVARTRLRERYKTVG